MSALSIVGTMSLLAALQVGMDFDMVAIEKWSTAKLVRYRVEGVHNARVPVVHGDYEGKADVIDVKGGLLASLREPQYSHRSLARWITRRRRNKEMFVTERREQRLLPVLIGVGGGKEARRGQPALRLRPARPP